MMEWLTNANTIAGLVVAIFGIGGYIFAIATFLRGKADKSIRESIPKQSARTAKKDDIVFDRMDWISAFMKGFWYFFVGTNDDKNRISGMPMGCIFPALAVGFGCALVGLLFFVILSYLFNWTIDQAVRGAFVIGLICWGTILLGIYIHYVGEAVETITKKKRPPVIQQTTYNKPTSYRRK